jgi:very-short-patch-repair endonuclease
MDLAHVARSQAGAFSHAQARAAGLPLETIRRRVMSGRWLRLQPPVYAEAACPQQVETRLWAAVLQVGAPCLMAGAAAARLWQLPAPTGPVRVLVPRSRRPQGGADLVVVRRDVAPTDAARVGGLPVTAVERTVLDCLRTLPARPARALLEMALQRRLVHLDRLTKRIAAEPGRMGTPRVRRILSGVSAGADSAAEAALHRRLRRASVTGWSANVPVHDGRGLIGIVDILFPERRLVVEVDGRAWHVDLDRFQRDRDRQNRLVAAGYTVLRFTADDVAFRPDDVVAVIRRQLDQLS